MKRIILISTSLLIAFTLSFIIAEEAGLTSDQNAQTMIQNILAWKNGETALSTLIFLLFSLDILLPVPSSLVMLSATSVLGATPAFLICFAGLCASAALAHEVCRQKSCAQLFLGKQPNESHQRWIIHIKKYGFWIIMITRPIPMMTELFSCLAGVAKMSRWSYYLATLLANLAFAFTYTLLPTALGVTTDSYWPLIIGFGLPVIFMGLWWLTLKTWGNEVMGTIKSTESSSHPP